MRAAEAGRAAGPVFVISVPRALAIVGSERRGAVFGTYDLFEMTGASPWHWLADVSVARRAVVQIPADPHRL